MPSRVEIGCPDVYDETYAFLLPFFAAVKIIGFAHLSTVMPTALVTGCNKGIGFAIAQGLCEKGYIVIMGCRDSTKAQHAEAAIKETCPSAAIHHVTLDITDLATVGAAAATVHRKFPSGIDVLVNNAGFAYHRDSTAPFATQAQVSVAINYSGSRAVCEALLPFLRPEGRIVNISSSLGALRIIHDPGLQKRWGDANSTADIDALVSEFVAHSRNGDLQAQGWPESAYGVSKLALTTYSRVLGAAHPELHVYACCPGWCRTDLTSNSGVKTAQQGADTPLWLAASSECLASIPQGAFVSDRRVA